MSLRRPTPPTSVRHEVLRLVLLVVVLDVVAIAAFYLADIPAQGRDARTTYTVVWTVLTLAVVLTSLRRVRLARDATRGRGRR